jgi:hypothetical protein
MLIIHEVPDTIIESSWYNRSPLPQQLYDLFPSDVEYLPADQFITTRPQLFKKVRFFDMLEAGDQVPLNFFDAGLMAMNAGNADDDDNAQTVLSTEYFYDVKDKDLNGNIRMAFDSSILDNIKKGMMQPMHPLTMNNWPIKDPQKLKNVLKRVPVYDTESLKKILRSVPVQSGGVRQKTHVIFEHQRYKVRTMRGEKGIMKRKSFTSLKQIRG